MALGYSPSLLIDGVECWIDHGDGDDPGITEGPVTPEGPQCEAIYKCRHEDRFALAKGLLGSTLLIGGVVFRTPPHAWPESPNLICDALGPFRMQGHETLQCASGLAPAGWVQPIAWTGGSRYVVIPAHYAPARFDHGSGGGGGEPVRDPSGQPYTTTRFRISSEVLTPPNGTYYYTGGFLDGQPIRDSQFGIIRVNAEISMTRHWIPYNFDLNLIMSLIGGVNAAAVTFANRTFPRGTLLFGGFNASEEFDSLGNWRYEIENGLLGRYDKEWNEILGQDELWHGVNSLASGLGNPPFKYVDFNSIP